MPKSRQQVEADLQNMLGVLQNTRDQLEQVHTQVELLRISLEEHRTAVETLEAYKGAKPNQEVLVPVGANAFIFAKSTGSKAAVTELGAGISAEVPIDTAVEKLRSRAQKLENSRSKMVETGKRLEQSAGALEQQIQELYGSLNAGTQQRAAPAKAQARGGHGHSHAHEDEEED